VTEKMPCSTPDDQKPATAAERNFLSRIVLNAERVIMVLGCLSLTLIICASVVARYILKENLYGYEEIVTIVAFWVYFMGGAYGAFNGTHISADLLNVYLPEGRFKNFVHILRDSITFGITILFTFYGYQFFLFGFMGPLGTGVALPTSPVWRIPMWVPYMAIFMGLSLMAFYFGLALFKTVRTVFSSRPDSSDKTIMGGAE